MIDVNFRGKDFKKRFFDKFFFFNKSFIIFNVKYNNVLLIKINLYVVIFLYLVFLYIFMGVMSLG